MNDSFYVNTLPEFLEGSTKNAEHCAELTYYLDGCPYVPHYSKRGVFVGPGGIEIDEARLIEVGATAQKRMLWRRTYL